MGGLLSACTSAPDQTALPKKRGAVTRDHNILILEPQEQNPKLSKKHFGACSADDLANFTCD
jgi:hypothetical protein